MDLILSVRVWRCEGSVDVAAWLRELGLERYEGTFRDHEVDADLLPNLTADDLKDLGVSLVGHRRHLSRRDRGAKGARA